MKARFILLLLCSGWIAEAGQQAGENSIPTAVAKSSLWEMLSEDTLENRAALISSDKIVSGWTNSDWKRYSEERASELRRRSSEAHSFEQERLRAPDVKSDPMKAFTIKWEAEKIFWSDFPPFPTKLDVCAITKLSADPETKPLVRELASALAEADRVAFGATSAKDILTARRILRIALAEVFEHSAYLEEEPERDQESNGPLSKTTATNMVDGLNNKPDTMVANRPPYINNKDRLVVETSKTEQRSSIMPQALILAVLLIMTIAVGIFIIRRR
jgi:hypothetical protein